MGSRSELLHSLRDMSSYMSQVFDVLIAAEAEGFKLVVRDEWIMFEDEGGHTSPIWSLSQEK